MPSAATLRVLQNKRILQPATRGTATPHAPRHRISQVDPEARTGTCSVCGRVRVAPNANRWRCSVQKADMQASWYNRHGRVANPSPHKLTSRDIANRRGVCPIDGQVEIVPFARGWACKVRADELGHHRSEPARKCSMCGKYDSRHNPVSPTGLEKNILCVGCARLSYSGPLPRTEEQSEPMAVGAAFGRSPEEFGNVGAHYVQDADWMNPEFMPDYESAVPGWKTLGAKQ